MSLTVVITGASKGVGAACAKIYAAQGANLVLVARGLSALEQLAHDLKQQYPNSQILTLGADIAKLDDCQTIISAAVKRFGKINVLINNAGLHHRGEFSAQSADQMAAMVDVNLRAPIYLCALALPHMPKPTTADHQNAIVMVGSLAGRAPLQGAATYSATKAGLRAFTYALHDELIQKNINVAVVSPGPIDTAFIMEEIDVVEDIVYSQPMSTPEQVAENVLTLSKSIRTEIAMPWFSGKLTTLGYLLPSFRRATRGLLYKIGKKNKQKYRNRID
ncbi:SDR family NAD(P)-dependent oxidoreductase [Pseudoalteromonas tunicata]|jgi:short-subunit dehydrogenase|uniref:Putative oxidoreductase, short-chain dehydrogenase/reductase family protein n=1 Tax=Pseudoalteromonas tunicata D2 TaxID=87626 RepID=A4CED7_9GAMM|nr:SDR family NAD(P)-dependent oxidoreductase [Pseudoalteromonas tunicata]ATC93013.1 hypothetical protein PTUN_a0183 [Pseudoalteromonas tunicata]AXT32099.1 SDR family NAD(P)-dependent oxidoreductase [Pseudoalteromonas tunicata]EAR26949.1 Putative oxidoreductase, short-chain dehydrogenase/reductase family protein [Pseudoalteromonas tunicata D2]MDP4982731.1 SDR family NAD(P)-dependent oxidoreductase [Pseudoalteromonas tunicata]